MTKPIDLSKHDRIVAIVEPGFMFNHDRTLGYLCVPNDLDLLAEQAKYDASRPSLLRDFVEYLLTLPNVSLFPVEYYHIRYPYG